MGFWFLFSLFLIGLALVLFNLNSFVTSSKQQEKLLQGILNRLHPSDVSDEEVEGKDPLDKNLIKNIQEAHKLEQEYRAEIVFNEEIAALITSESEIVNGEFTVPIKIVFGDSSNLRGKICLKLVELKWFFINPDEWFCIYKHPLAPTYNEMLDFLDRCNGVLNQKIQELWS